MIKVSFIMSVYNTRTEWIDRSVSSVLAQTAPDWELIIVDDGSKKDVAVYCDEIAAKDERISIHHQENQGLSVARNYGMDHARGQWVAFLDADDWIEETYVEQILKVLDSQTDLEILAIGHDDIWDDKAIDRLWGNEELHIFDASEREGMQMALLQSPDGLMAYPMFFGGQWKIIYSLKFLNQYSIRNTPGLYKAQDSVFNLYVTEYATEIGYYNKILYHYFHNSESVTGGGFNRNLERFQKLVMAYRQFIDETGKADVKAYQTAYTKVALLQFEGMLHAYFTNRDNPDSTRERKQNMEQVLNCEPYRSIIMQTVSEEFSIYRRLLLKLMMRHNYALLCLLYRIKCFVRDKKNRKR